MGGKSKTFASLIFNFLIMRYLDKWNQTKESVQELLNEVPDFVITYRANLENFEEIEELSRDLLKIEGLWKKGKNFNTSEIWWAVSDREPVLIIDLDRELINAKFMLEPLVLDNYILVGYGMIDSDVEELTIKLDEIEIYKIK